MGAQGEYGSPWSGAPIVILGGWIEEKTDGPNDFGRLAIRGVEGLGTQKSGFEMADGRWVDEGRWMEGRLIKIEIDRGDLIGASHIDGPRRRDFSFGDVPMRWRA